MSVTPALAEDTGVAECDAFLKLYENCANTKAPADAKQSMLDGAATNRSFYIDALNGGTSKEDIAKTCIDSAKQMKQTFDLFGCKE